MCSLSGINEADDKPVKFNKIHYFPFKGGFFLLAIILLAEILKIGDGYVFTMTGTVDFSVQLYILLNKIQSVS